MAALYKGRINFVNDEDSLPSENCLKMKCMIQKVQPFTVQKRKRFRISDKVDDISPTIANKKQRYPPEFKEYFEQNFKKQFFLTRRVVSDQLKNSFSNHAVSLRPDYTQLYEGDEMNRE